jgi:hypothetical protein
MHWASDARIEGFRQCHWHSFSARHTILPPSLERRGRSMRIIAIAVMAALLGMTAATPVAAEQCRDPAGKFIKCPPKPDTKAKRCKDASGKFAKCGTPGAKPV